MAKRTLTRDEQILWKLYTNDVEKTSDLPEFAGLQNESARFDIKIPKKPFFKLTPKPTSSIYENLKNKDNNWSKRIKRGKVKPEGKMDLHGMTCVEAHEKLLRFLERSQNKGRRFVLVVTGKGGPKAGQTDGYAELRYHDFERSRGVLKREVPLWLSGGAMGHMIVSFEDAMLVDGGGGALYVILKRK